VTGSDGQARFNLPEGNYRFRADKNGRQYFSGVANHCAVTGCGSATVIVPVYGDVMVDVVTNSGTPQSAVTVYAFSGTTYTGFSAVTGADGQAAFTLPEGNYRFRADKNGVQYWSGTSGNGDTCSVPDCISETVTIPVFGTVTATVVDTEGMAQPDVPVYVFNGTTYTGFHATTDAQGRVSLALPEGNYRLRADKNGIQYWSGGSNHCSVPECSDASVIVPIFGMVTVSVENSTGAPQADLPVYVFNGTTYTGFQSTTDPQGQASFTLPAGDYRFRVDLHGHSYWSGTENHCSTPVCGSASISVPIFGLVTATVQYRNGEKLSGLPVYAFTGQTYSGISAMSDGDGRAQLWLPEGTYRFRTDQHGLQFWSGEEDHCAIPGCETAVLSTYAYGTNPREEETITYSYDALYRLTAADYESGLYFRYAYRCNGKSSRSNKDL